MATTTKKAPRRQTRKPAAKAADRTLDRVPPDDFRVLVQGLGLTQREVAEAVGRSPALVGGWLGHTGQMRPGKDGALKPTNPPLARPRLAEVTRELKAFAKAKGSTAKAMGPTPVTPNPKDLNAAAHAEAEKPARPHVPPELVARRRAQREAARAN